jgi:hypothetical protein
MIVRYRAEGFEDSSQRAERLRIGCSHSLRSGFYAVVVVTPSAWGQASELAWTGEQVWLASWCVIDVVVQLGVAYMQDISNIKRCVSWFLAFASLMRLMAFDTPGGLRQKLDE